MHVWVIFVLLYLMIGFGFALVTGRKINIEEYPKAVQTLGFLILTVNWPFWLAIGLLSRGEQRFKVDSTGCAAVPYKHRKTLD